jgi:hypothetical protein
MTEDHTDALPTSKLGKDAMALPTSKLGKSSCSKTTSAFQVSTHEPNTILQLKKRENISNVCLSAYLPVQNVSHIPSVHLKAAAQPN